MSRRCISEEAILLVKLARDIVAADSMVVMTHFKAMRRLASWSHQKYRDGGAVIGKKEQHACRMAVKRTRASAAAPARRSVQRGHISS